MTAPSRLPLRSVTVGSPRGGEPFPLRLAPRANRALARKAPRAVRVEALTREPGQLTLAQWPRR
ncbi:MAG: hypothetical protein KatS3mg061_3107 [Dehalococcoidia bacterium]|nr:MAG: hypothetical protein KatS3mg061_3107 [Dehalococcoidia bacterium]